MKVAGGVGTTAPGGTGVALVELQAGRYDFIATGGGNGQPLFARGAQGSFEVSGTASGAKLPATPAQIRTVERSPSDYGFETSGLKAGTNRVTFTNTGAQLHHVVVAKLQPGATFEKAKEFLASDEPPPGQPPVDFDNAVGSAVLDSGGKEVMTLDLESGSYVFVCFLSDRTGSQPHAIKAGMINEVQVP